MRRIAQLSLVCLAAAVGACGSADLVNPTEVLPYAGVRFINAVPDSAGAFGMDFRFVDLLESNAHFRITFRNTPSTSSGQVVGSQIEYKGAREGKRHFKIFLNDTIQSIASVAVVDTSETLVKLHNYTAMLWGNARSLTPAVDGMNYKFWEETAGDPGAGKFSIRVINATNAAIDARWYAGTASAVQAGAASISVPAYTASAYTVLDTGSYMINVRAAGSGTNLVTADVQMLFGAAPTCSGQLCLPGQHADIEAAPGTRASGSALSAIVFPRSTAGARTPQTTAFATPATVFTWDKRPARSCDPYC